MTEQAVLAVDVGGSKMAAGLVDRHGRVLGRTHVSTPPDASAEVLFATLSDVCREVLDRPAVAVHAIGVGCSGPMEYPAGVVSPLNIPGWRGFPLRARLSAAFGQPCVVDNDGKAMALGEHWQGAGRGSNDMLGMVVSTGVGGGIILGGRPLHGSAGNSGHVGHIIVWPNGPLCGCGARGCIEGVSSGSGLARRLSIAVAQGAHTSLVAGASAAEIAQAARQGDGLARELFRTAGEGVGRGIASAAALLDLERVVIGGSIALKAWDLLGPPLLAELERAAQLNFTRGVQVVQAQLGDAAGLYGAAYLAYGTTSPPA